MIDAFKFPLQPCRMFTSLTDTFRTHADLVSGRVAGVGLVNLLTVVLVVVLIIGDGAGAA